MTAPGIGIVYATHRPEPHFDWFADGLATQLDAADTVEVVVVDGLWSEERQAGFQESARGRFPLLYTGAKPTPWNGEYRLTCNEYAAPASARNTGVVHTTAPYLVFQDDRSVMFPGWLAEAVEAARHGYVVAGACHDHWDMLVEEGFLVTSRSTPLDADPRWKNGHDARAVAIGGGSLTGEASAFRPSCSSR